MTRVLLDTHTFLWWVEGAPCLPSKVRATLGDPDTACLLSMASAWEMAVKASLGKLKLARSVRSYVLEHVAANGFVILPIELAHVGRVESLPRHHGDPFDRLLIAQSIEERMPIVSADPAFEKYDVERIWQ